jgi:nucleoside-diphosphate-sugar epimerase
MRNVVLIGGSGYLGSNVLNSLLKRDLKIYTIINKTNVASSDKNVIVEGGINALTVKFLERVKPEVIYHCGRPTYSHLKSIGRRLAAKKAFHLNSRLLKNIKKGSPDSRLVFASGSLGYGSSDTIIDETAQLNPISYSRQYIAGEYPVIKATEDIELNVLLLRFPWLLGNGSWYKWFYLNNIKESGHIPVFGEGRNIMSIIDLRDAAALMVKYGESSLEKGIFNIFSPEQISQLEFVHKIMDIHGCNVVPYEKIYPKLEKAAREAFLSNIELGTLFGDILNEYSFTSVDDALKRLKSESGL